MWYEKEIFVRIYEPCLHFRGVVSELRLSFFLLTNQSL